MLSRRLLQTSGLPRYRPVIFHVCGIRKDKTANCWGGYDPGDSNYYGQGEVPEEYVETKFSRIAPGYYHNCGILDGSNGQTAGEVVCWGAEIEYDPLDPENLGGGRATPPDFFYPPTDSLPDVDTGRFNNCALTRQRDMICWGGSVYAEPLVEGPFETLSVGDEHVCALREGGVINCWGREANTVTRPSGWARSPSATLQALIAWVRDLSSSYSFKAVSANRFHTCGILRGANPLPVEPPEATPTTRVPSEIFNDVSDSDPISELSDGQVLCWGLKLNGQALPPSSAFTKISSGVYHTCGLLDEQNEEGAGTAVCWGGQNNVDENGMVVTTYAGDPRADYGQVEIPAELRSARIASISSGRYHTCAVREDNNALNCWGRPELASMPIDIKAERFETVSVSDYFSCGITAGNHVKCWGPTSLNEPDSNVPVPPYELNQFHVPEEFAKADFIRVSAGPRHVCATQSDGRVYCWGADANPGTPEIEIYIGRKIINTRQAWVPRSFRALPPPIVIPPKPTADVRILRIEPTIRGVTLDAGQTVRLDVAVYGRQDIRDDSLADRQNISFDWTSESPAGQTDTGNGHFEEAVSASDARDRNGAADDIEVLYTASDTPGNYVVTASLEPGVECLGKRDGETDEDAQERCSAEFEVTARRAHLVDPTPIPPRDPAGDLPNVIVDDDGTNYEVFTPEGGGEFSTDKCSLKIPNGAVNDMEVIGVSVMELETPDEQVEIADLRFMTDGTQCEISAVDANGEAITDYQLLKPGNICMPLPDRLRPKAVDAFVGSINSDSTLTALSSKLYLATSAGGLNVCGNISSLSATTTVALRAEVAGELPPTPVPIPDVAELDTGGLRLSEIQGLIAMLLGVAILALAVGIVLGRRRARNH